MKNTNIKQIAFMAVTGLFLSACGGGGGGSNIGTIPPVGTNPPVIEIKVPSCGVGTGKAFAKDVTGKTRMVFSSRLLVRIWHSPDATKLACMISGEVLIVN